MKLLKKYSYFLVILFYLGAISSPIFADSLCKESCSCCTETNSTIHQLSPEPINPACLTSSVEGICCIEHSPKPENNNHVATVTSNSKIDPKKNLLSSVIVILLQNYNNLNLKKISITPSYKGSFSKTPTYLKINSFLC